MNERDEDFDVRLCYHTLYNHCYGPELSVLYSVLIQMNLISTIVHPDPAFLIHKEINNTLQVYLFRIYTTIKTSSKKSILFVHK